MVSRVIHACPEIPSFLRKEERALAWVRTNLFKKIGTCLPHPGLFS